MRLLSLFKANPEGHTYELFSIQELFGYGLYIELEPRRVSDKMLDMIKSELDAELWLFGRVHIIISNEKAYRLRYQTREQG
jgi:hypothetical protein